MQAPSPQHTGTRVISSADHDTVRQQSDNSASSAASVDAPKVPTPNQVAIGKWVHKHRHATEGIGGFLGYQVIRNSLAAIPYGIATAGVWLGMEKLAERGEASKGSKSLLASTMRSPLRDIAMIAAGFTLFRGTLKVVRYMKERLFDPQHTEEQTIQEVQHFRENLVDTLKEVTPAEVASTPTAAIALGIGRRFWDPKAYLSKVHADGSEMARHSVTGLFKAGYQGGSRFEHIKRVFGKKGGYLQEAAIVATSFVPFFELADRRYKDAQVARGVWLNDPASLVRKSDEQAKAELQEGQELLKAYQPADNISELRDKIVKKSAESLHATGHLRPTDTPTFGCFVMRRVVPTFLGIGAYVAGKRLAYMGMGTIPENYTKAATGMGGFLKNLGRIAMIEGAATSLFWINASVIDKYEPWYDKTFKDNQAKPLSNQEVLKHYRELQARLDAKEQERKSGISVVG